MALLPATMPSGLGQAEARRHARQWWDTKGRHIIRNPEWRDPDLGFPSGLTRGLEWALLTLTEQAQVIRAWDANHGRTMQAGHLREHLR